MEAEDSKTHIERPIEASSARQYVHIGGLFVYQIPNSDSSSATTLTAIRYPDDSTTQYPSSPPLERSSSFPRLPTPFAEELRQAEEAKERAWVALEEKARRLEAELDAKNQRIADIMFAKNQRTADIILAKDLRIAALVVANADLSARIRVLEARERGRRHVRRFA